MAPVREALGVRLAFIGEVAHIECECRAGASYEYMAVAEMAAVGRFLGVGAYEHPYPPMILVNAPATRIGGSRGGRVIAVETSQCGEDDRGHGDSVARLCSSALLDPIDITAFGAFEDLVAGLVA